MQAKAYGARSLVVLDRVVEQDTYQALEPICVSRYDDVVLYFPFDMLAVRLCERGESIGCAER